MARKRIPDVQVSAMEVDTEGYPSLGGEIEQNEKAEVAAPPPAALEMAALGAPERAQRQSAWLMASIAGLIAVIALTLAWSNRGLEGTVMALLSQADAKVTAQMSAVKEESAATFAAAQAMVAKEQAHRRQLAGALAVTQLETAVRSGRSYVPELELATDLLAEDEDAQRRLATLAPAADAGLPRLEALQAGFSHAVSLPEHRALMAAVFSSLRASVSDLFSFAPSNGARNGTYTGRMWDDIKLAQRALSTGDLHTAALVVEAYGDVLPNARVWMQAAQQRLEAEDALLALKLRSEDYLLAAR